MAHPVKAAKQMFDQFLAKHDPGVAAVPERRSRKAQAAASALAAKGGAARAASLSPKKRTQIAKRAAEARWAARVPIS